MYMCILLGIHICRRCLTHKELMKEGHCMGPADLEISESLSAEPVHDERPDF